MSAKFVFAPRSKEQIEVFGGEVFADINGKKVATIGLEPITCEVVAGTYTVRMYKSHEYGSMIGFAEIEVTVSDSDALVFVYSPPMKVSQPGHIVVSDFISYQSIENEVKQTAIVIKQERANKEREAKKMAENQTYWWLLVFGVPAIVWFIYEMLFWNLIF